MLDTLLSTKLHIPQSRRELVLRPRLTERLDVGLRGKLTLACAPAGYGKTTLVSDWIARAQIAAAWLSLDASDNDLGRFFSYLIAALQQIDPDIGMDIQPILETDADLPIERLLTALVNDIVASGNRFALILDDYHVITEFKIHQALDFLFDHLPPGMHVVLISRANPPMPLGRLRVQGQLTEIREVDLRFTPDEATAFMKDVMGLGLSSAEIERLEARTEGWIAGLQLAALTVRDRADKGERIAAFTGSHRHLIEYLVHEVMARQPEEVHTFLLHTSILERFTALLCDAVVGNQPADQSANGQVGKWANADSQDILEHLERANLFLVPLDDEGHWYRYHHLFADFLLRRLRRTRPDILPELYVRASQWYEDQGMLDEAIEHALAGDDVTRAARVLDESAEAYVFDAQINRLIRWANRLPEEERIKFPRLCIYYAWALQFEYQFEAAESALESAEAYLDATVSVEASTAAAFSASQIAHHARAIRVYIALQRGEPDRAIELARAALEALTGEEVADELLVVHGAVRLGLGIGYFELGQIEAAYRTIQSALSPNQRCGNRYALLSCIHYLMRIDLLSGALGQALARGRKGLLWIEQWSGAGGRRRPLARLLAHIRQTMALVHYERNELDEAVRHIRPATEYYELVGSRYKVRGYALLVDLHRALGEIDAAREWLDKLVQTGLTPGVSLPDTPEAAMIAEKRLLLSRTDSILDDLLVGAARWAETVDLQPDDTLAHRREYESLVLAQIRIAQGRAAEVLPLLERLVAGALGALAGTTARKGRLITFLVVQAVAYHACGQIDAAQDALSRALALGEPEGYVRTFVDYGAPMADLLRQAQARGVAVDYVGKLLAATEGTTKDQGQEPESPMLPQARLPSSVAHTNVGRRPSSPQIEPFNDREMQILRLLAAGLSDRQIAEELYLSINTVKWHNRQIYSKLGVGRRGQAVARAQELGLL
jgi:LuxR family maltose regulon positive regulatory protein